MSDPTKSPFEGWAILELMGHKRLAGYVTEVEFAGSTFTRIDVPGDEDGDVATQLYGSSAIYCLTPTTEATARRVARMSAMAPVERWQLEMSERRSAALEAATVVDVDEEDEDPDVDEDDRPTCRICGCTDDDACVPPCWWVQDRPLGKGDLCSSCLPAAQAEADDAADAELGDLEGGPDPNGPT